MPDETLTPAGPDWCAQFPTSVSLDDLAEPFQSKAKAFIAELQSRSATVGISATYRPAERAYLMHYCCMIAKAKMDPALVPPMDGVAIQWDLGSPALSIAASAAMVQKYEIAYPAALVSRHTQRLAVDMTVAWAKNSEGGPMYSGDLYALGASFGVIKLLTDPPHWSNDGH